MLLNRFKVKAEALSGKTCIYALRDPDTDAVRYVGATRRPPKQRIAGHLYAPTNSGMAAWLTSLREAGRKPVFQILEEVKPAYNWPPREKFWVSHLLSRGCDLLNARSGGIHGTLLRTPMGSTEMQQQNLGQEKVCQSCGRYFQAANPGKKYCSPDCAYRYRPKPKWTRKCISCAQEFETNIPNKVRCRSGCRLDKIGAVA